MSERNVGPCAAVMAIDDDTRLPEDFGKDLHWKYIKNAEDIAAEKAYIDSQYVSEDSMYSGMNVAATLWVFIGVFILPMIFNYHVLWLCAILAWLPWIVNTIMWISDYGDDTGPAPWFLPIFLMLPPFGWGLDAFILGIYTSK